MCVLPTTTITLVHGQGCSYVSKFFPNSIIFHSLNPRSKFTSFSKRNIIMSDMSDKATKMGNNIENTFTSDEGTKAKNKAENASIDAKASAKSAGQKAKNAMASCPHEEPWVNARYLW
eukprot:TRINITY_DN9499_c0_g2_i1.p1 TRINITY_DN9499_c0_g2~~TRINITY_DN9499_c0_g2_i1.p1  ORF type:complete len:118 (+),score=21.93 TRINITY_DN9499_c0_g2_i1:93-446(+)